MKKKVLVILILTFTILCLEALLSNVILNFSHRGKVYGLEDEKYDIKPYIFYDTHFDEVNPKQLINFKEDIYVATNKNLYKYDFFKEQWVLIKSGGPNGGKLGTINELNYKGMNGDIVVKNYSKIVSDTNNDGNEIYELNLNIDGEYQWNKIVENGKFIKTVEEGFDRYSIESYNKKYNSLNNVVIGDTEYYLRGNKLYSSINNKSLELIKDYSNEKVDSLKITKIGQEAFIYGGIYGVERIIKDDLSSEVPFKVSVIGQRSLFEDNKIIELVSADEGHTLFCMDERKRIYKLILEDTWVYDENIDKAQEILYGNTKEERISELEVNNKIYKIETNKEWGKSYITVNNKILSETMRDSYLYPDNISRFNEKDDNIYIWNDLSQPIKINTKDDSVINMGQKSLFKNNGYKYKGLILDSDENLYIVGEDEKYYRYIEKDKFYDEGFKAYDIEVINEKCYGINESGIYQYNDEGNWTLITKDEIKFKGDNTILDINNNPYCIFDGILYRLDEKGKLIKLESKINCGLSNIFYDNKSEKRIYFLADYNGENDVIIYDYAQDKWSRTKELKDISNINSIVVDKNDIYVSTKYAVNGGVFVYKSLGWECVFPKLDRTNYSGILNSKFEVIDGSIYIQTYFTDNSELITWKLENGSLNRINGVEGKNIVSNVIDSEEMCYTNNGSIAFTIKNGRVLRKII